MVMCKGNHMIKIDLTWRSWDVLKHNFDIDFCFWCIYDEDEIRYRPLFTNESGSFRPDDLFAPGRFAPLTCSPRKVSRFAPLNCYYIIIDEVFLDNFFIIIYLLASCCGFSYYYRFSDIAISSVNPSFIWILEFSKNG